MTCPLVVALHLRTRIPKYNLRCKGQVFFSAVSHHAYRLPEISHYIGTHLKNRGFFRAIFDTTIFKDDQDKSRGD
jgi:hypothetical protein